MISLPKGRLFWSVGLGHFVNDTFMSMGPVILAFLSVSILPMSNTQIGLTVTATQLLGAITQPGFGILADRNGGRWLGAGGVAWTVSCLALTLVAAQTGEFWLMFFPFVGAALGSGAFHPAGAMHAADSDRTRVASNMSYFFLMGQMGLAFGPMLAGIMLDVANPGSRNVFNEVFRPVYAIPFVWQGQVTPLLIAVIIAFPPVMMMSWYLPSYLNYQVERRVHAGSSSAARVKFSALPWKAFGILGLMVALRSLAQPGSVTFIPVLFQDKGWSPSEYGALTSSFWVASGFAGVMFGNLADRIDRRVVVATGLILSAPAFFLLPLTDGSFAFALAIIAGGLSGGSHSIIVVLAQELIPAAKGFASGAILGFIFGTGALGSFLIGTISDAIGLETTFQFVAATVVVAGLVALALPGRPPARIITLKPEEAVVAGD